MINRVVELRAHGNPILVETTCAKLIFKGVNPEAFNDQSPDDAAMEMRIREIASDWGILL